MTETINIDITKYIVDQALVLIPVLYVIGSMLKQSAIKDWMIPWILMVVGIGLALYLVGLNVQAIIQGTLCAGASTYIHQLYKQSKEKQ